MERRLIEVNSVSKGWLMTKHQSSEQLMALVGQGCKNAFTKLVKRHSQAFFRLALNMLHDEQEAEDVIQESFLKIWNKPNLWDPHKGSKFTTWFYKIVFYGCLDKIKKNSRVVQKPLSTEPPIEPKQESHVDLKKNMVILEKAMSKLSEKENNAIILCLVKQLTHVEAAREMDTGVRSLQGILLRAKNRIRSNFLQNYKRKGESYGKLF